MYYFGFESREEIPTEGPQMSRALFPELKEAQIDEVSITAQQNKVALKRDDETFSIVLPEKSPAEEKETSRLVAILKSARFRRQFSVDEDTQRPQDFGLAKPSLIVQIKFSDEATGKASTSEVMFGGDSPSGAQVYAMRRGTDKVLLVSSELVSQIKYFAFVPPVKRR